MRRARSAPALAVAIASALTLAGCSGTSSGTTSGQAGGATSSPGAAPSSAGAATSAESTSAAGATVYPLTVDNCGTSVTFEGAPKRIVTIKSATTELLLALGAGDRIVATAYPDGPVPEPHTAAAASLPVLADRVPSQEVVLEQGPDLVYAGWESNFSPDGAGERAGLEKLGVRTFVAPSACKGTPYRPDPLTFDNVYDEIALVGQIMDASGRAGEVVAAERATVDAISPDTRGLSALWFSSGSDIPYVGGGTGAPALMMATAGLTNIAAEIDDSWGPFGWEDVAAADPDVIVLVDSEWNSAEKKIGILEGGALTSQLTAVRNRSYVVIPFAATEAGVRTASATADLADQVAALPMVSAQAE